MAARAEKNQVLRIPQPNERGQPCPRVPRCWWRLKRTAMRKLGARTTEIWSAVTRHRFPEGFRGLSPKQGRVQRLGARRGTPHCVRRRQVACRKRGQVRALQNRWWRLCRVASSQSLCWKTSRPKFSAEFWSTQRTAREDFGNEAEARRGDVRGMWVRGIGTMPCVLFL